MEKLSCTWNCSASCSFKHSNYLFTKWPDFMPMLFYIETYRKKSDNYLRHEDELDKERALLCRLVKHGGGCIINKMEHGAYRLLRNGDKAATSGCFYSFDYVHKCVEQNKLLDIEQFRISAHVTEHSRVAGDEFGVFGGDVDDSPILIGSSQEQLSEHSQRPVITQLNNVDSSNNSPISRLKDNLSNLIQKGSPITKNHCTGDSINAFVISDKVRMRRKKYNEKEDIAIMKYIVEHKRYREVKGIKLWRDMEELQVTIHSAQSMKDRFRRYILPGLDNYSIDDKWRTLFRHQCTICDDAYESDSDSDLSDFDIRLRKRATAGRRFAIPSESEMSDFDAGIRSRIHDWMPYESCVSDSDVSTSSAKTPMDYVRALPLSKKASSVNECGILPTGEVFETPPMTQPVRRRKIVYPVTKSYYLRRTKNRRLRTPKRQPKWNRMEKKTYNLRSACSPPPTIRETAGAMVRNIMGHLQLLYASASIPNMTEEPSTCQASSRYRLSNTPATVNSNSNNKGKEDQLKTSIIVLDRIENDTNGNANVGPATAITSRQDL